MSSYVLTSPGNENHRSVSLLRSVGRNDWGTAVLIGVLLLFSFAQPSICYSRDGPQAVDNVLPHTVLNANDDALEAKRQAQMAITWGLYNSRRKEGGEIESESIDMHVGNPVTKTCQNKIANQRVITINGVAATGIVEIITIRIEHIEDFVVQTTE